MGYTFCNQCGHRNPPESNFCSSCGAPLDVADDRTITIAKVDPHQDAIGPDDDIVVPLSDIKETAVLIVRSGPQAGSRFLLDHEVTDLGRHPESRISLDDITVSRRHAEIRRLDDGYVIVDAGSLNGTYVNQERVERSALVHGDEIQIGKFRLVFFDRSDA